MKSYFGDLDKTKEKLNSVSCSMCLAKWTQVTLHLHNGTAHSCHYPSVHKIPYDELENNYKALHNTKFKKLRRKEMLEGTRPEECQYCWNIEDSGSKYSARIDKSSQDWSLPHFDEIIEQPWDADVNPKYVEVSFSSACNFKCSYCTPVVSSKWAEEAKQYGPYPTSTNFNDIDWFQKKKLLSIPERENNPFVEAFWKWWPELYETLQVFRITGGEPLMSKDTFKVLEYIKENPNPNLSFGVNSNLGVPDKLFNRFLELAKDVSFENKVKQMTLYTSVDAWGKEAEYIRHGLNFEEFWKNLDTVLTEIPNIKVCIMSTYNALSVTSYRELLKGVLELKKKHKNEHRYHALTLDTPYLSFPEHQILRILTPDYFDILEQDVEFMKKNSEFILDDNCGFGTFEIDRMSRLLRWATHKPLEDEKLKVLRSDFYKFCTEHDRRRGTNFLETFSQMKDFWELCKSNASI